MMLLARRRDDIAEEIENQEREKVTEDNSIQPDPLGFVPNDTWTWFTLGVRSSDRWAVTRDICSALPRKAPTTTSRTLKGRIEVDCWRNPGIRGCRGRTG